MALRYNGTVWSWGDNSYGQCGPMYGTYWTTPRQITSLSNIIAISAGSSSSYALQSDGTVWAWGGNWFSQLGDGTTTSRSNPARVMVNLYSPPTCLSGVTDISGGEEHCLALTTNGTVYAWGRALECETGGFGSSWSTPLASQCALLSGRFIAISAGRVHSMALRSDGTVWCWGGNSNGQLGNGTTSQFCTGVQAGSGVFTGPASAIDAGANHSLAILADGTVWAWGLNSSGQFGNNTTLNSTFPVQSLYWPQAGGVSGGGSHTLCVATDRSLWSAGANAYGQLGDGDSNDSAVPLVIFSLQP